MCDYCNGKRKELSSVNFCGEAKMRIVADTLDLYDRGHKIKFLNYYYAPRFKVNYCPMCGRKL